MVDFAIDVYQKCNDGKEAPEIFIDKRFKVVNELKELQSLTDPILNILMREDVTKQIESLNEGK